MREYWRLDRFLQKNYILVWKYLRQFGVYKRRRIWQHLLRSITFIFLFGVVVGVKDRGSIMHRGGHCGGVQEWVGPLEERLALHPPKEESLTQSQIWVRNNLHNIMFKWVFKKKNLLICSRQLNRCWIAGMKRKKTTAQSKTNSCEAQQTTVCFLTGSYFNFPKYAK